MALQNLTLNSTGYYEIEQGVTLTFPWSIGPLQWIRFISSHTGFSKNQSFSIRIWCSVLPDGSSITGLPDSNERWIAPSRFAQNFAFYDINSSTLPTPPAKDPKPIWMKPVPPDEKFYINIKNMENKLNFFFLTIETNNI